MYFTDNLTKFFFYLARTLKTLNYPELAQLAYFLHNVTSIIAVLINNIFIFVFFNINPETSFWDLFLAFNFYVIILCIGLNWYNFYCIVQSYKSYQLLQQQLKKFKKSGRQDVNSEDASFSKIKNSRIGQRETRRKLIKNRSDILGSEGFNSTRGRYR